MGFIMDGVSVLFYFIFIAFQGRVIYPSLMPKICGLNSTAKKKRMNTVDFARKPANRV